MFPYVSVCYRIPCMFQYTIRAPRSGVVEKAPFAAGATVQKGARLVHLKEEEVEEE